MNWQVILQPDGTLAVFDETYFEWLLQDATPEDVEECFAEEEGRRLARHLHDVRESISLVLAGNAGEAYDGYALTFKDATEAHAAQQEEDDEEQDGEGQGRAAE